MSDFLRPHGLLHGILQARILEWVAIPFSKGSSQLRDWTQISCTAGGFFTSWATREPLLYSNKTLLHKKLWEIKPHHWPWVEFLSSGGHGSWCYSWLLTATFQYHGQPLRTQRWNGSISFRVAFLPSFPPSFVSLYACIYIYILLSFRSHWKQSEGKYKNVSSVLP